MAYINVMRKAGVQLTLADYRTLAALNRDDICLFNEAEAQRMEDEMQLQRQAEKR